MAIRTSGPLSLTEIQNEFGGTRPSSLTEYYKRDIQSYFLSGGGPILVPDIPQNANIPSSGRIRFSNFYNSTKSFTNTYSIGGLSTNTFAQTAISNDSSQPGVSGAWQKFYYRTFQGFLVASVGTTITVPDMSITIRGDEDEDCIGSNENTGIRNPGIEIVFRSGQGATPQIVGSFRASGQSTDDDVAPFPVSVTGGTITCTRTGYYTFRWVADVYSESLGQAPINIFNVNDFTSSSFGVTVDRFVIGGDWG